MEFDYDKWADVYDLVYSYVKDDIKFFIEESKACNGEILELGSGPGISWQNMPDNLKLGPWISTQLDRSTPLHRLYLSPTALEFAQYLKNFAAQIYAFVIEIKCFLVCESAAGENFTIFKLPIEIFLYF